MERLQFVRSGLIRQSFRSHGDVLRVDPDLTEHAAGRRSSFGRKLAPTFLVPAMRANLGSVTSPLSVDPAVVADLCADLRGVLEAELAAGNVVVETSRGWPGLVSVWLGGPFRARLRNEIEHVVFREINDPHYWLSEYECTKHQHLLACRSG